MWVMKVLSGAVVIDTEVFELPFAGFQRRQRIGSAPRRNQSRKTFYRRERRCHGMKE